MQKYKDCFHCKNKEINPKDTGRIEEKEFLCLENKYSKGVNRRDCCNKFKE